MQKKKYGVDKGSDFYNRSIKSWLKTDIKMHSVHNEEKSVVVEKFIRNLKNKVYKQISSILKNVYIDKVDDIVNESNNIHYKLFSNEALYIFFDLKALAMDIY